MAIFFRHIARLACLCLAIGTSHTVSAGQITATANTTSEADVMITPITPSPTSAEAAGLIAPLPPEKAVLELVFGDGRMSNNYGNASGVGLRSMLQTEAGALQGELVHQSRFGFNGDYGYLSLTHDFSPDYYANVGTGVGSSELFPSWRLDATGYRKFGATRQFVIGLGTYYAKGQERERSDNGVQLIGIVYSSGLVVEVGLRVNIANPGSVSGASQYVAATIGSDDQRALILRVENAKEAYQVFTSGDERVNYDSQTYGIQWRERVTRDLLLLLGVNYYQNPIYHRMSLATGLRWSFR